MPSPLLLLKALGAENLVSQLRRSANRQPGLEHLAWQNAGRAGERLGRPESVGLTSADVEHLRPRGERVVVHTHPPKSLGLPSPQDLASNVELQRLLDGDVNDFVLRPANPDAELSWYRAKQAPYRPGSPRDMLQRLTSNDLRRTAYDLAQSEAGFYSDDVFDPTLAAYVYSRRLFEPDLAGGALRALLPVNGVDVAPLYEDFYKFAKRRGWTEKAGGGRVVKSLSKAAKRARYMA